MGGSTSRLLPTSEAIHESLLSDDSSQYYESGMLNDCTSNGVVNETRPRLKDNAFYSQCVLAMCTLANYPSPCIASLGQRILSILGIEQAVTKSFKSSFSSARQRELTTPSPSLARLVRSLSWFDMNSAVNKLHNQIASWDTEFEMGTMAVLLQPFSPVVIAADESERIRIWNYEEATVLNSFDNHDYPNKGVLNLCLVNDLDDSLLLVASRDGNVQIWKDYTLKSKQKLVTTFSSIQGDRDGVESVNAVVDWQQQSGYLYASGEISSIMAWDLDKEQHVNSISSESDCSISALSASQVYGGQFAAGFVDGSIRLFDIRMPKMLVCAAWPHTPRVDRVVGIGLQPGLDPAKIISASQAGDIRFLDIRQCKDAYLTIDAHRGSLTALAIHLHAPIIASGSAKQYFKVFNLEGEQLGNIRSTFMGQKIGSVSCLTFHPYQVLLATGAADARISLYVDEIASARQV